MSGIVCPTVTATTTEEEYKTQMERIAPFAHRIQIDLADGVFASPKTVGPELAWWPVGVKADIHIMFKQPFLAAKEVLKHQPNLVIVHAESNGNFQEFYSLCRDHNVKVGVALLPATPVSALFGALDSIDHVLVFSGNLGEYGGSADLKLLAKVKELKAKKPSLEIGWDGGVNDQNAAQLILGDVDVLNVGGFIQKAEDPEKAYHVLERIASETGTT